VRGGTTSAVVNVVGASGSTGPAWVVGGGQKGSYGTSSTVRVALCFLFGFRLVPSVARKLIRSTFHTPSNLVLELPLQTRYTARTTPFNSSSSSSSNLPPRSSSPSTEAASTRLGPAVMRPEDEKENSMDSKGSLKTRRGYYDVGCSGEEEHPVAVEEGPAFCSCSRKGRGSVLLIRVLSVRSMRGRGEEEKGGEVLLLHYTLAYDSTFLDPASATLLLIQLSTTHYDLYTLYERFSYDVLHADAIAL
jgi:hypothetical protein